MDIKFTAEKRYPKIVSMLSMALNQRIPVTATPRMNTVISTVHIVENKKVKIDVRDLLDDDNYCIY